MTPNSCNAQSAARFWSKVDVKEPSDCWVWLGRPTRAGGVISIGSRTTRKNWLAHRLAATLSGIKFSDHDDIGHSCKNVLCCNPAHLYVRYQPPYTQAELCYNPTQRKEFPLVPGEQDHFVSYLMPLRAGRAIGIALDDSRPTSPKYRGKFGKRWVGIAPGSLYQLSSDYVLISIANGGAALVKHNEPNNVAKLVLAGMPATLAKELMNKIHLVLLGT